MQGRDSSSSGDKRNPNPGADQFDLYQAFVTLGSPQEFPLTLKVGRQELQYGDERLVGTGDWGNLGRSFDAVKLRYEKESTWVEGFVGRVVMPDNHNFNMPNDYDYLMGIYASTRSLLPFQDSQLYFLSHNVSRQSVLADPGWLVAPSRIQDTYTVGVRASSVPGQLGHWDYVIELAGQFGTVNNGAQRLDQEAFYLACSGGYTWKTTPWQPRAGLGYDFVTGDDDPTDQDNQTFEPLFPTNHRLFGYMDLIGPRNIHNPRLNLSAKPHPKWTVTLDYHLFWLADTDDFFYPEAGPGRNRNGYGRNPGFDSFVGHELDLDLTYAFKPWAILRTGYAHFFAGDYIRQSLAAGEVGHTDADWFYLQTTLSF